MLRESRPDVVIHLAAVGRRHRREPREPGRFFYENAVMGIQLIEEGAAPGVDKFVTSGTICAYPKFTPVPFREEDLWNGYPEETNAPYGLAKKMLLVQAQAYRAAVRFQRDLPAAGEPVRPARQLRSRAASHVIPALIRKCVEAVDRGAKAIIVLGRRLAHARVPVRRGRRRGHRARGRALRRERPGEPRRGPRDHHPRAHRADRRADRLQRQDPLGRDASPTASRGASSTPRAPSRSSAFGEHAAPRGPAAYDRLVPLVLVGGSSRHRACNGVTRAR